MTLTIRKDTDRIILSSESKIIKTEAFIKETARFESVDAFVSQFAEGLLEEEAFWAFSKSVPPFFKLQTTDGAHTLYVALGEGVRNSVLSPLDIVFYGYEDKGDVKRKNDLTLLGYLSAYPVIEFTVLPTDPADGAAFHKLYVLFNADQVNFPLLNEEQRKIVFTEDANVLVQGVAGSGKTNICIDKIIYAASRGYQGKVLYSTFSRGLLIDTQSKIKIFRNNLDAFRKALSQNKVVFGKGDRKKAVENKLGIFLNVDDTLSLADWLNGVVDFLDEKVECKLLQDFLPQGSVFADEEYFIRTFLGGQNKHTLGKLSKIAHLSQEVVYKEIYGMITGYAEGANPLEPLSFEEYAALRAESFSRKECEIIYSVAQDYARFMESAGAWDNNSVSRRGLREATEPVYSLAVLDEVQDFTQINLAYIAKISRKVFCVGDALQMINPAYFGFAYVKRLLYDKDVVSVTELKNNYRNTSQITEIVNALSELNIRKFGTHNFVLKGRAVDEDATTAVYVEDKGFAERLAKEKPNTFTIVVSNLKRKEELRKKLPKQEILTVAEIKGLERETVLLYNVLSDNADKWKILDALAVNRKKADENSVYRYYFNLFYVGISRAKKNLYVVERNRFPAFEEFFQTLFVAKNVDEGVADVLKAVSKTEFDRDELIARIEEFKKFGQFDNAVYTANKLEDDKERRYQLSLIDVHKRYLWQGDYKGAGIAYWALGDLERAKQTFLLSGDEDLCKLVDEVAGKGDGKLSVDIVRFYPELKENESAKQLIVDTLLSDVQSIKNSLAETHKKLGGKRKNGKR